jgi:hypothetical protein
MILLLPYAVVHFISSWCVTVAQAAEDERCAAAAVGVRARGRGAAEVEVRGAELRGRGGAAVLGAQVVEQAPEQVAVDGHRRLVRDLAPTVVDGRHLHAPEHRRPAHVTRQALPERRVCVRIKDRHW